MSFSDFILATLVLAGIGCVMWIMDINPLSKELQIYNQTCTNMILDNTYCKGEWVDKPVITYFVDKDHSSVTVKTKDEPQITQFNNCTVIDRKNWTCSMEDTAMTIQAINGKLTHTYKDQDITRQITRLQWLQNKLLTMVSP